MKFLSLALFASAVMGQASVVSDALANIQSKTEALDSAVNSFSGSDTTALQSAASAVIAAINQGNTNVAAIAPLDSTAAFTLVDPINALAGAVHTAVNDLLAKQGALSSQSNLVNQNLNSILDATNTFSATTFSKIPTSLVPTARMLVQPIIDDLNRAITAFPAGPPSGGSSSSSAVVSSSSAAVSSSAGSSATGTVTAPTYSVSATATESASSTLATSASASVVVPPTSVSPPITSQTSSPAPYNPNGASQLSGGFAAVVVAAAVAVAAF